MPQVLCNNEGCTGLRLWRSPLPAVSVGQNAAPDWMLAYMFMGVGMRKKWRIKTNISIMQFRDLKTVSSISGTWDAAMVDVAASSAFIMPNPKDAKTSYICRGRYQQRHRTLTALKVWNIAEMPYSA